MRKIFILVILSLFLLQSFGLARQERFYHVLSFEKGLNTQISPWLLKDNQASIARNLRFNETYGSAAKRNKMLQYGTTGWAITSMHRYYNTANGTDQLLVTGSTKLALGDDSAGTFSNLMTGLTDGARWQWVTYKDIAIGTNGTDQPLKYDGKTDITANTDGHRTAGNLTAELSAPFAELDTGTDLDASKWYQYKVAWYDGTTYTYSTAVSNAINTGADVHNIALTGIPLGPSGTTFRYIYRTSGAASKAALSGASYYMVYAINDNTSTTQADSISDATLETDRAPTWATVSAGTDVTPPTGTIATLHKEKLWISGNTTNRSDIYWSDEYNPDYFAAADYEQIRPDDGDKVTFMKEYLGILTIGKQNSIQHYYTDSTDDTEWYASAPFSFVGCPAPYSVAHTPIGLIYLARTGLYRWLGTQTQLISDAITPEILDILETNIENSVGIYWGNEYQLAYTSATAGGSTNNRVAIYDTVRDAYSLDHKNISAYVVFDSGSDYGVLYSGESTSTGTVYAHRGSPRSLIIAFKSDLDAGTFNDTRTTGTETNPTLELGWDCTIDGWLTELQTKNANINTIDDIGTYLASAIIDRPDTAGTWVSPTYEINASTLDKLYWHEVLGDTGDITLEMKLGSTAAAASAASYGTSYTNPLGSDVSSETANSFIILRASLSTSDIDYTPSLYETDNYIIKLLYGKQGTSDESDFTTMWQGGWEDFGLQGRIKQITRIKTYYEGDTGDISFRFKNAAGDFDTTFTIDLDQAPYYEDETTGDTYTGIADEKVYTYYPVSNEAGVAPEGQFWMFSFFDTSTDEWTVNRIEVMYEVVPQIFD